MASNAIAVATTLVLPRVLVLLQLSLPYALHAGRRLSQRIRGRSGSESGRLTSHAMETFRSADSIGNAASKLTRQHLSMQRVALGIKERTFRARCRELCSNLREDKWGFSIICLAVLGLGAFYVGIQAIAILTARMLSSSYGISRLPSCGFWVSGKAPHDPRLLNDTNIGASWEPFIAQRIYEAVFEAEAQLARHGGDKFDIPVFTGSKIRYLEYLNEPCPFANECCAGERSAFTLDTGAQSARILGINAAEGYTFRKRISCAPLVRQSSDSTFATRGYPDPEAVEKHYMARPGDTYSSMQVLGETSCRDTRYRTG